MPSKLFTQVFGGPVKKAATASTVSGGKFEGRQGSVRRSAKGRTRIMPNGRRVFVDQQWADDLVAHSEAQRQAA